MSDDLNGVASSGHYKIDKIIYKINKYIYKGRPRPLQKLKSGNSTYFKNIKIFWDF